MSEALCDRFVCGMCNYTIVDQTAQGNEMGEKKASDMTQLKAWPLADLNNLSTSNTPACYRCGKIGHTPSKCCCKEWVCHNCGKKATLLQCVEEEHITSTKELKDHMYKKTKQI